MDNTSEALSLLAGLNFQRAKASRNPHEYIVRGKHLPGPAFTRLVETTRAMGIERGWGGKTYIVWYAPDGYHYWTMGWPAGETTILNRAITATEDQTYDPKPEQRYSSDNGLKPVGAR